MESLTIQEGKAIIFLCEPKPETLKTHEIQQKVLNIHCFLKDH